MGRPQDTRGGSASFHTTPPVRCTRRALTNDDRGGHAPARPPSAQQAHRTQVTAPTLRPAVGRGKSGGAQPRRGREGGRVSGAGALAKPCRRRAAGAGWGLGRGNKQHAVARGAARGGDRQALANRAVQRVQQGGAGCAGRHAASFQSCRRRTSAVPRRGVGHKPRPEARPSGVARGARSRRRACGLRGTEAQRRGEGARLDRVWPNDVLGELRAHVGQRLKRRAPDAALAAASRHGPLLAPHSAAPRAMPLLPAAPRRA